MIEIEPGFFMMVNLGVCEDAPLSCQNFIIAPGIGFFLTLGLGYTVSLYVCDLPLCCRVPRPADEKSGAQGKLIRLIEDQLASGEVPLDLERLRNQFTLADRLHRDSLSHGEIKEICYRNRVPLQESVINHVLDRCRTTGDGQYRYILLLNHILNSAAHSPAGRGFSKRF